MFIVSCGQLIDFIQLLRRNDTMTMQNVQRLWTRHTIILHKCCTSRSVTRYRHSQLHPCLANLARDIKRVRGSLNPKYVGRCAVVACMISQRESYTTNVRGICEESTRKLRDSIYDLRTKIVRQLYASSSKIIILRTA